MDSAERIILVQKYKTRKDTIASLLATSSAWILSPTATDAEKKSKADQLKLLRKLARTAETEYLQCLVSFQYGEEGVGALPESESYSLVPPEVKKKLDAKKKDDLKMKKKDEELAKKQDFASKARETYSQGQFRYKPAYKPRYNSYAGSGSGIYASSPASQSFNNHPGNGLQAPGIQGGWLPSYQGGFPQQPFFSPQGFSSYAPGAVSSYAPGPSVYALGMSSYAPGPSAHAPGVSAYVPGVSNYALGTTAGGSVPFKPSPWYSGPPSLQQGQPGYNSRELQERKRNSKCGRCDTYGHWHGDNLCKAEDVERKMAKLQLRDAQYQAEASALRLTHHQEDEQPQGN